MHIVKLNLKRGLVFGDLASVTIDDEGVFAESIETLCLPPVQTDEGRMQYRLSRKVRVCGQSADSVIEVDDGRVFAVTFLFNLIEFFEYSVLESKILKACEKSLGISFLSNHPSTAFWDSGEWLRATFFYDAKQGDLSLNITIQRRVGGAGSDPANGI